MGLIALFDTLKARRFIVLWAILVGAVIAGVTGVVLPKQYQSVARVLVDSIQKDTITGLYEPRLRVAEFLGQQAAIAGSRTVALETIDTLTNDGYLYFGDYEARWRRETGGELVPGNDARLWAADELLDNLYISADAVEGTLSIGFRSNDPSQSARIANAFADAYMKTVLDQRQRRSARNAANFSEERALLERDLSTSLHDLNAFREEEGIVGLGEQRLEAAEVELTSISARLAEARADNSEAQSLLTLARSATLEGLLTLPLPGDALAGRQAQARLGAVVAQLQRLGERYGENYPDYVEVNNEKEALQANILQAIVDRADYTQRRVSGLEATAAKQKTEVLALQEKKQGYDILAKKVAAGRQTYDLVANRSLEESLQSRIDNIDVILLARAVPQSKSITPPLAVIALIGVVAGAAIGSTVAVFLEFSEGRIRRPDVMRTLLRAPVLAEVAVSGSPVRRRRFFSLLRLPRRRVA